MDISILHEDEDVLVINKPPGVVVNRAESVKSETIQDWTQAYLHLPPPPKRVPLPPGEYDNEADFYTRAGIAHRIDKETSGILVIAKTVPAYIELLRQFRERVVKKTYLAIVHGVVTPPEGEIRAPVGRLPWNKERFGILPGGKEAVTRYRVQHSGFRVQGEDLSVLELFPETGRTHQIRIHLKYINHPILGDYLYAGRKTSRDDRTWAARVMLHAWKISFLHPASGQTCTLEAPVPDDMMEIINKSTNTTNLQMNT